MKADTLAHLRVSGIGVTSLGAYFVATSIVRGKTLSLFGTPAALQWMSEWLRVRAMVGAVLLPLGLLTVFASACWERPWAPNAVRAGVFGAILAVVALVVAGVNGPFQAADFGVMCLLETGTAAVNALLLARYFRRAKSLAPRA